MMFTLLGMSGATVVEFVTGLFSSVIVRESRIDQVSQVGPSDRGFLASGERAISTRARRPAGQTMSASDPLSACDASAGPIRSDIALLQTSTLNPAQFWESVERSYPVLILDYIADQDQITLQYDPDRIAAPEMTVTAHPGLPGTVEIRLNAHLIAFVANAGDLRAEDILLIADNPGHIAGVAQ